MILTLLGLLKNKDNIIAIILSLVIVGSVTFLYVRVTEAERLRTELTEAIRKADQEKETKELSERMRDANSGVERSTDGVVRRLRDGQF